MLALSGKFSKTFTYDHAAKLWQDVTEILNASNGAEKDWKSWRKCWQDYRSRSKTKQAEINIERRKTGGGARCSTVLTTDEEQVLQLIPVSSTKGHAGVLESSMDTTFGEEDDLNNLPLAETEKVELLDDDCDVIETSLASAITGTSNIDYSKNIENCDPSMRKKLKRSSSRQILSETKDSTRIIAEVAEKTYVLKKNFCEEIIQCKKRIAKTQERMATVAEKCAIENCKII